VNYSLNKEQQSILTGISSIFSITFNPFSVANALGGAYDIDEQDGWRMAVLPALLLYICNPIYIQIV
jgi:hypothetical protein